MSSEPRDRGTGGGCVGLWHGRAALLIFLAMAGMIGACGHARPESSIATEVVSSSGGSISSGKGVVVEVPPGAVPDGTIVTIKRSNVSANALPGADSLGAGFVIDLGGKTLSRPVTLEITFDPKSLPLGGIPFLAYYDEEKGGWIPVSGTVDKERGVVVIQTDHLSWWNPFSWNWANWRVILDSILTADVTQFLESIVQSSKGCPQSGTTVTVDETNAHDIIQGCVDRDDPQNPDLRVINQRTFFVEERPTSGGNGYPESKVLSPGEELAFTASTTDPALVVSADLTQKAGVYLVIHLFIQMLPGFRELGVSAPQISCIVEKLHDVSYVAAASEALVVSHDGGAAAEQLIKWLLDADAVRRFITGATDCAYPGARAWSVEGIQQIGAAVATIHSAVDFIVNYFRNNHSEVAFNWTRSSFQDEFAYCSAVGTVDVADGRWAGPVVPSRIAAMYEQFGSNALNLALRANANVWRCYEGKVLYCVAVGTHWCGKIRTEPNERVIEYCRTHPDSENAGGRANFGTDSAYFWGCGAGQPVIIRQFYHLDPRGFASEEWQELSSNRPLASPSSTATAVATAAVLPLDAQYRARCIRFDYPSQWSAHQLKDDSTGQWHQLDDLSDTGSETSNFGMRFILDLAYQEGKYLAEGPVVSQESILVDGHPADLRIIQLPDGLQRQMYVTFADGPFHWIVIASKWSGDFSTYRAILDTLRVGCTS